MAYFVSKITLNSIDREDFDHHRWGSAHASYIRSCLVAGRKVLQSLLEDKLEAKNVAGAMFSVFMTPIQLDSCIASFNLSINYSSRNTTESGTFSASFRT